MEMGAVADACLLVNALHENGWTDLAIFLEIRNSLNKLF